MDLDANTKQLVETLLLERDELYREVLQLRNSDAGTLEAFREKNREYEAKIEEQGGLIEEQGGLIKEQEREIEDKEQQINKVSLVPPEALEATKRKIHTARP